MKRNEMKWKKSMSVVLHGVSFFFFLSVLMVGFDLKAGFVCLLLTRKKEKKERFPLTSLDIWNQLIKPKKTLTHTHIMGKEW